MINNKEEAKSQIGQLQNDYNMYQKWSKVGFFLSIILISLGFLMLAFGIFGEYLGFTKEGVDLSLVSSIILEFVSGTAFFIFRYNIRKLNSTSKDIQKTHLLYLEFENLDELPQYERNIRLNKLLTKIEKNYFKNG